MRQNDGGPAFPTPESHGDDYEGMSLRDYFAAAALQGALKDHENTRAMRELAETEGLPVEQYCARSMYSIADAMIAERNK